MATGKLTIKQGRFCNKYLECGNASEAYRCVYGCSKMNNESINRKAFELLNNGKITARVKEMQEASAKRSEITKDRVLAEYAKIAFCSIAHLHNTWIERKEFELLTEEQKASIKSISTRTRRIVVADEPAEIEEVKIELFDKLRALEGINKMLGYDAPEKADVRVMSERTGTSSLNELPVDTLKRVREAINGK